MSDEQGIIVVVLSSSSSSSNSVVVAPVVVVVVLVLVLVLVVVVVFIQDAHRSTMQARGDGRDRSSPEARGFTTWVVAQKRILEIFLEAALSLKLKDQSQNYRETPERQQFLLNAPRTNLERAPKCYREAAHQYWCNHSAVQPLSAWHHYH